jgi:hypothetical protein
MRPTEYRQEARAGRGRDKQGSYARATVAADEGAQLGYDVMWCGVGGVR